MFAASCNKGRLNDNAPPETTIFLDTISLTGTDRLTTEFRLFWAGEDVDGYVTGYELSFDGTNWSEPVTTQDSTFNFSISAGSDTVDIDVYIRAIDNLEDRDPTPAYLRIPIKNSPPVVDSLLSIPDTIQSVFSVVWTITDPDGDETLDSIFVKINGSGWYGLDPTVSAATFVPQNPETAGATDCDVYADLSATLLSKSIEGLLVEGDNVVYVKARDIAGSESEVDTTNVFHVLRKTSDLLVVNTHESSVSPTPQEVYHPIITAVYSGGFDYLDMKTGGGKNLPQFWSPTFELLVNLYDKVFWYSDDSDLDGQMYLDAAAAVLLNYLDQGGKLFITTEFVSGYQNDSPIIDLAPMDSLSTSSGQARITTDSVAYPNLFISGYDTLVPSSFITGADPFYVSSGDSVLYNAQVKRVGGWSGPTTIAAIKTNSATQTNMVFFSIELHKLNGNPTALQNLFSQVLLNEFNW